MAVSEEDVEQLVGTRTAKEKEVPLSQIIDVLNERFGTTFTKADQLFFDQIIEYTKADVTVQERARANDLGNFALSMKKNLMDAIVDRMDANQVLANKSISEQEFQDVAFREMVRRFYDELRADERR
jgi:type I restriction enzyme R subunit